MESLLLTVKGMSCGHCKAVVEQGIRKLPGIKMVDADVGAGTVMVSFDASQLNLQTIKDTLNQLGYEAL